MNFGQLLITLNIFNNYFFHFGQVVIDPTINDSHIKKILKSTACTEHPYSCQAKMIFEHFKWEIHYTMKVFHVTYKKFLTTLDHIDYHPSHTPNNTTRTKRSILHYMYGNYYTPTKTLTPSEENFLDAYMKALYQINPSLHNKLSCMKRSWYLYLDTRLGSILKC